MKAFSVVALLLALSMLLGACSDAVRVRPAAEAPQDGVTAAYRRISAEEAKVRLDSGDPILLVDVRTRSEYEAGHIQGAILLPNEDIGLERPESLPDPDAEILLYCRSGNRSRQAVLKLLKLGYTKVFDLGGISAWPYGTVTVPAP